jgi:heterodisulfide reductase subunit A
MTQPNGSVLIVGGGVAGIQAALDLAESGFFVYLVDKTPAIGGVMAQLDKTFPTTDCSMCILAPYLVAAGRHPNIELVTNTQLDAVSGNPGHFKVKLKKKARYIDMSRCTGCRACVDACPVQSTVA